MARLNRMETWSTHVFTLADNQDVTEGTIACIDTAGGVGNAGECVAADAIAGLVPIGLFMEDKTTSGATAPVKVRLFKEKVIRYFKNSGSTAVTAAMVGLPCYLEDSETVSSDSTDTSVAGTVWAVDSALGVGVEF